MDIDWVATATLVLAGVTAYLAWQVHGQTQVARDADVARQREVHVLAVRPLLIKEPTATHPGNGRHWVKVKWVGHGDLPVVNLGMVLHGQGRDGQPTSTSTDRGSLPAGEPDTATLDLEPFLNLVTGETVGPGLEIEVTWHGILGQWIVEKYEWNYNLHQADPHSKTWRLHGLEIAPLGVKGAASVDQHFGAPPLFSA